MIQNIGGMANPFEMNISFTDGTEQTIHQTPAAWEQNQKQITIAVKTNKKIKSVEINGGIFMDADESNNRWSSK